jgi:hypothetical protein
MPSSFSFNLISPLDLIFALSDPLSDLNPGAGINAQTVYRAKRPRLWVTRPSLYLYNIHHDISHSDNRLELRILLMYHFALAFRSVDGTAAIPCCAKEILERCKRGQPQDESRSSDWTLASYMSSQLNTSYIHYGKDAVPPSFKYSSFWATLLDKPHKFELCEVSFAEFLLQRAEVNPSPVYARISSTLHDIVTERDHWSPNRK